MIIFFGVFFTVYGLVNYYIFIRGWQALPPGPATHTVYTILFLIVALSFIAGRVLERFWISWLSESFVWIGSFWLAAMVYFLLAVLLLDLLRLINALLPFFPSFITADYEMTKHRVLVGVLGVVAIVLVGGYLNALTPRVRTLTLNIAKTAPASPSMTLAVASDIHLGTIVGRSRFDRMVQMINDIHPDLVLLPGDIVDEDLAPVLRENLGETLRNIRAKYGVLAVTGNHEYIGGAEQACAYLVEHGVRVLRDSAITVNGSVTVVGREDRSISQFAGKKRKALGELMNAVDTTLPVILMDHQPFGLAEASAHGVDLQLSGHTHHGQLWPFNYITAAIYELSWGYMRKGGTHYYVSSGVGTWGPPVRTGNTPEILRITLSFGSVESASGSAKPAAL